MGHPVRRIVTTVSRSPSRTVVARNATPGTGLRATSQIRDVSPSFESHNTISKYIVRNEPKNSERLMGTPRESEKNARNDPEPGTDSAFKKLEREYMEMKRLYWILKDSSSYSDMNKRLIAQFEELTKEVVSLQEQNERLRGLADDELVRIEKTETKEIFGRRKNLSDNETSKNESFIETGTLNRDDYMSKSQAGPINDGEYANRTVRELRAEIDKRRTDYWKKQQECNESKSKCVSLELQVQELEQQLKTQSDKLAELKGESNTMEEHKRALAEKEREVGFLQANEERLKEVIEAIKTDTIEIIQYNELKHNYEEQTKQIEELKARLREKEHYIGDYTKVIDDLNSEITNLRYSSVHNQEAKESVDGLETALKEKEATIKEAQRKISGLTESLAQKTSKIESLESYMRQNDPTKYQREINELSAKLEAYEKDAEYQKELLSNAQSATEAEKLRADTLETQLKEIRASMNTLNTELSHRTAEADEKIKELENQISAKEVELESQQQVIKSKEDEIELLTNEIQFINKYNQVVSNQGSKRQVELDTAYQRILNYDGQESSYRNSKPDVSERQSYRDPQAKATEEQLLNENGEDFPVDKVDVEWQELLRNNKPRSQQLARQMQSQDQLAQLNGKPGPSKADKEPAELSAEVFTIFNNYRAEEERPSMMENTMLLEQLLQEKCDTVKELKDKVSELEGYISGLEQDNQIILDQNKDLTTEVGTLRKEKSNLENLLNEYSTDINKLKSNELGYETEKKKLVESLKKIMESAPINFETKASMLKELKYDNALILVDRAFKLLDRRASKDIQLEFPDLVSPILPRGSLGLGTSSELHAINTSRHHQQVPQKIEQGSQCVPSEPKSTNEHDDDELYRVKYFELFEMNHQLSDKIVALYDQINHLETQVKSLREKNSKLNQTISKNNILIESLRKEKENINQRLELKQDMEEAYKELEENNQNLHNEYSTLKEQYTQLLSRVSQRRSHILNELNNFAKAKNEFNNSFFSEISKATNREDK